MDKKFIKSYNLLRKEVEKPTNSIMWTAGEMDKMSYIECWLVQDKGIVIFQVLPEGVGFNEYIVLTTTEQNASKMLQMIKTMKDSMKEHSDSAEEYEFEHLIGDAEELIRETTGVKLKKV